MAARLVSDTSPCAPFVQTYPQEGEVTYFGVDDENHGHPATPSVLADDAATVEAWMFAPERALGDVLLWRIKAGGRRQPVYRVVDNFNLKHSKTRTKNLETRREFAARSANTTYGGPQDHTVRVVCTCMDIVHLLSSSSEDEEEE